MYSNTHAWCNALCLYLIRVISVLYSAALPINLCNYGFLCQLCFVCANCFLMTAELNQLDLYNDDWASVLVFYFHELINTYVI